MAQSFVQTNPGTTTLESQSQFGTILESPYGVGSGSGEGLRRKVPVDNTGSCITSLEEDLEKIVGDAVIKLQLVEKKKKDHLCMECLRSIDICDCPHLRNCDPRLNIFCSHCGERLTTLFPLHCVSTGELWVLDEDDSDHDSVLEAERLLKYPNADG